MRVPHINFDLTGLEDFRPTTGVQKQHNVHNLSFMQKKAIETYASASNGSYSKNYATLDEVYSRGSAPVVTVTGQPKYLSWIRKPSCITVGLGPVFSGAMAFAVQLGFGVCFSNGKPHVGGYFSVGVGGGINVGLSGGGEITVMLGPPHMLGGTCFEVAVTANTSAAVGVGPYVGASLLFDKLPGTAGCQIIGFTFGGGVGAGPPALPGSLTLYLNAAAAPTKPKP